MSGPRRVQTSPTWRCGHPRTPTPVCPVCKAVRNAAYRAAQKRRVRPYIVGMTPVQLAEARALLDKAMAEQERKVGRPRRVA